jgi:CrcB protein
VDLLLVTLGGGIGSAARYLVGAFVANYFGPDFPWGTYIVNISGSFLIGVVLGFVGGGVIPTEARPLLAVGFLGGYTTFSTYSHESLQLIQGGEWGAVASNTISQVVFGLVAVYLGVVLSRTFGGVA